MAGARPGTGQNKTLGGHLVRGSSEAYLGLEGEGKNEDSDTAMAMVVGEEQSARRREEEGGVCYRLLRSTYV